MQPRWGERLERGNTHIHPSDPSETTTDEILSEKKLRSKGGTVFGDGMTRPLLPPGDATAHGIYGTFLSTPARLPAAAAVTTARASTRLVDVHRSSTNPTEMGMACPTRRRSVAEHVVNQTPTSSSREP